MKRRAALNAGAVVLASGVFRSSASVFAQGAVAMGDDRNATIVLPDPDLRGHVPLEQALRRRRSMRSFDGEAIRLSELGQLLWAAQGASGPDGLRTAPSAGALYPLEIYAIASGADGLPAGIYRYRSRQHRLQTVGAGDYRADFAAAAFGQDWTARSAVILVIAAAYGRTTAKYGERGRRYVAIEAGHAAQNIYLQTVALGRGATEVGAFDDHAVSRLVKLPSDQEPVTSVAVGRQV
jgi:SagB-type dehydrogenase family enzyme